MSSQDRVLPDRVSAVVFDCDGLLVDTETSWSIAEAAIFAAHGFEFGPEQKRLLLGQTISGGGRVMAEYFGQPDDADAVVETLFTLVEEQLLAGVEPLPGVAKLVEALAGRIPVAVASNSPRRLLDVCLTGSGLGRYFGVTVAADEVEHPKPHPELYLEAFARLGADPARGVALEDSGTGVAAARASGAFLITVPSMPGRALDGDYITASLDDPAIREWAQHVRAL